MKKYKVVVFYKILNYLSRVKKNRQAAANVMHDYQRTRATLSNIAGSLRTPENEALKSRNLKRLNFAKHDYFLLFRVDGDTVTITNIFHSLEDFEGKL